MFSIFICPYLHAQKKNIIVQTSYTFGLLKLNPSFLSLTAKSCPTPPGWREDSARNGSRQEFHVGQSVRVACPKGQQVKGSGTITCRPDQTWSPISSVCESRYNSYRLNGKFSGCITLLFIIYVKLNQTRRLTATQESIRYTVPAGLSSYDKYTAHVGRCKYKSVLYIYSLFF